MVAAKTNYDHDAFGVPLPMTTSETIPQRYTYTGRESSGVNGGPMYYRNRTVLNGLGIFGRRDPAGYAKNRYGNLYGYVRNMPIRFTDPFGLEITQAECEEADGVFAGGDCCCGGKPFNPYSAKCCGNKEVYAQPLEICCDGVVYNNTSGKPRECCGDELVIARFRASSGDKCCVRNNPKLVGVWKETWRELGYASPGECTQFLTSARWQEFVFGLGGFAP